MTHELFSIKNPNKVRSLLGAFAFNNPINFHQEDGAGYQLLCDKVLELDPLNPQVAARIVQAFNRWKKYDQSRRQLMQRCLQTILDQPNLSRDVYEIVTKNLA